MSPALATQKSAGATPMTVLCDNEIKEAIQTGDIEITPFDEDRLEPASYDFRVGRVLMAGRGVIDPKKQKVELKTGEWAEIETFERIRLSGKFAASYGLRSGITRRGIVWFGGPQIDPGYGGRIFVSVFNPSSEPFQLEHGDPFCSVIFHRLGREPDRLYDGAFQGCDRFPEEDVERMLRMKSPTLADVVTSVGLLETTVEKLTKQTGQMASDMGWVKRLLFAILIAIVIGIAQSYCRAFLAF